MAPEHVTAAGAAPPASDVTTTTLNFDVYLRSTPDQIWHALTDPATVPRWRFGMTFSTDWSAGAGLTTRSPDGVGSVLDAQPGQRLAYDWEQSDAPEANGGHRSTVSFALTPMGEVTHLHVEHSDLEPDGPFTRVVTDGWPMILSSLKSLIETGEPLAFSPAAAETQRGNGTRFRDDSDLPEITDQQLEAALQMTRPYTIVVLEPGPSFEMPGTQRSSGVTRTIWTHAKRNYALHLAGLLPVVCPVGDGSGVVGIGVFNATPEDVERIMARDPAVTAGVLSYDIHPTRSFPGSTLPR